MSDFPHMPTTKIIPGEPLDDFVKRVDAEAEIYATSVEKYLISQESWLFRIMRCISNIFRRIES
jgi:hypothetical protein